MNIPTHDASVLRDDEHQNEDLFSRMTASASSECALSDFQNKPERSAFRAVGGAPLTVQQRLRAMFEHEMPQTISPAAEERCSSSNTDGNLSEGVKKDADYLARRRKNNNSARRSREVRRQREIFNKQQAEVLEKENVRLRAQITLLRLEVSRLSLVLLADGVKSSS
ncbi:unnamed protein product [Cylicocyclus nassatus]|uniref:BZIP domain-containing protein n=1 Tax=Cylicocyclus nassatus TaxID=53992 RepID=A0AA36GQ14_CYLNA|nr:unnamed protein product [Cylicocyclus nassatus]